MFFGADLKRLKFSIDSLKTNETDNMDNDVHFQGVELISTKEHRVIHPILAMCRCQDTC